MAGIAALKDNTRLFLGTTGELKAENKVTNVASIGDINPTVEEIEVTCLDSQAKEFVQGWTDNGSIEVTLNITDDEYATMVGYRESGEEVFFGLSILNLKKEQVIGLRGKGLVMSASLTGMSVGSLIQTVVSIRVTGEATLDFVDPTLTV